MCGDGDGRGGARHRRVVASDPLREQDRHCADLQGRVRVPPDLLHRGRDRRDPGGEVAARQRRREQHRCHVAVLDQAIAGLAEQIAVGHRSGDEKGLVQRRVRVRTDSAGCTDFVWRCRERNIGFSVVARRNASVHAAISRVAFDDEAWTPALTQNGEQRPGAAVAELTGLADLTGWPEGTRLIVRREPLHPGAQGSLFASAMFRYWGHYTDSDLDPVAADVDMRGHARVEDNIRRLKDSGASRFPFTDLDANRAWLDLVCFADALVRWFQLLCLPGRYSAAEPKTMRWAIWHTPARIVRHARKHVVRILDGWPATGEILAAYRHIELLT